MIVTNTLYNNGWCVYIYVYMCSESDRIWYTLAQRKKIREWKLKLREAWIIKDLGTKTCTVAKSVCVNLVGDVRLNLRCGLIAWHVGTVHVAWSCRPNGCILEIYCGVRMSCWSSKVMRFEFDFGRIRICYRFLCMFLVLVWVSTKEYSVTSYIFV